MVTTASTEAVFMGSLKTMYTLAAMGTPNSPSSGFVYMISGGMMSTTGWSSVVNVAL